MSKQSPTLLPIGIRDILPPESWQYHAMIQRLLLLFKRYGYDLVIPPLLEFQYNNKLHGDNFYMMDSQSQKMMQLRSDMTMPIARIAEHRLHNQRPLRLCYAGDVCRVKGDMIRPERCFHQIGIELIGQRSEHHDIEVIAIALHALQYLNIKDLTLDLTIPSFFDLICQHYHIDDVMKQQLSNIISTRDHRAFDHISSDNNQKSAINIISKIIEMSGDISYFKANYPDDIPANINLLIQHMFMVYQGLKDLYPNVNISFDLFEYKGFSYQSELGFTIFSTNVSGELGRGGQYKLSDNQESAIGFSLYSDILRRIINIHDTTEKTKNIDTKDNFKNIKSYVEQDYFIKR